MAYKESTYVEDEFADAEKKQFLSWSRLAFIDKIKKKKMNFVIQNMFIDKYNRNCNLIEPSKDPMYFNNLQLSKDQMDL